MLRLTTGFALVATLALTGCSVSVTGASPTTPPAPETVSTPVSAPPSVSSTPQPSSHPADLAVPGYPAGQFPPVPLFPIPDTSVLSTAGTQLRDKLQADLPQLPGVTLTAVQCRPDGSYVSKDSALALYGDGSGSYVGPDGSYTSDADGSETSVAGGESITRDGKGGGTYVGKGLSVTNDGDGSGTYVGGGTSITLDGNGAGTYKGPLGSITNDGDGSGTFVGDGTSITVEADGSGTYVSGGTSISNDGKGTASIVSPAFVGDVKADPLPPVLPMGKFPPVEQLLPKTQMCGFVITLADGVLFDFDKSVIRSDAAGVLDDLGSAMKAINAKEAEISGHTDAIGSDAYNLNLSQRRADSVVAALKQRGVGGLLSAKGYGESRPVAPNEVKGKDNPAGRQLNRRVEVFVRG